MGIFYVSFQRPPPVRVSPGESLRVCLTLTNDLRSEPFFPASSSAEEGAVVVRLVWALLLPSPASASPSPGRVHVLRDMPGAELRWTDPSCAFRVVEGLKAPPVEVLEQLGPSGGSGSGRKTVSLVLGAYVDSASPSQGSVKGQDKAVRPAKRARRERQDTSDGHAHADDGRLVWPCSRPIDEDGRDHFVPVLSGPIELSSEPGGGGKQNDLLRVFRMDPSSDGVDSPGAEPMDVVIQEETGFELDKHIWDASLHLLRLFSNPRASAGGLSSAYNILDRIREVQHRPFNIVELGAGTAIVSIFVAKWLQSRLSNSGDEDDGAQTQKGLAQVRIYASDLESALPLIRTNLAWNDLPLEDPSLDPSSTEHASSSNSSESADVLVQPLHLDWTQPRPKALESIPIDLILISDCTYNQAFYTALLNTMEALTGPLSDIKADTDDAPRTTTCILAKKNRHPDEQALWIDMESRGMNRVTLIEQVDDEDADDLGWGIYSVASRPRPPT